MIFLKTDQIFQTPENACSEPGFIHAATRALQASCTGASSAHSRIDPDGVTIGNLRAQKPAGDLSLRVDITLTVAHVRHRVMNQVRREPFQRSPPRCPVRAKGFFDKLESNKLHHSIRRPAK